MVVNVPTEVIPVWYIKKWTRENSEPDSPLDVYMKQMIAEWKIEEKTAES